MSSLIPELAIKFSPLGDKIIVLPLKKEDTVAGITIPDDGKAQQSEIGVILSVSKRNALMQVIDWIRGLNNLKVGDRVLISKYSGENLKLRAKDNHEVTVVIMNRAALYGTID